MTELVFDDPSKQRYVNLALQLKAARDQGDSVEQIVERCAKYEQRARERGNEQAAQDFADMAQMAREGLRGNQEALELAGVDDVIVLATVAQGRNALHTVDLGEAGLVTVAAHKPPSGDRGWLYRYTVVDSTGEDIETGEGPTAPRGEPADPRKAADSMLSFLIAAGEAHQFKTFWRPDSDPENLDLFNPDTVRWAGENLEALEAAQLDLQHFDKGDPDFGTLV